jgi:predicted metal-dependent peptidase
MHLQLKEDPSEETAWTDGSTIGFNPNFISSLTDYERMFIFKHEVWHCILNHHTRREGRNHETWNEAADRVIHFKFVHEESMKLMDGVLYDINDQGLGVEQLYNRIKKEKKSGQEKKGRNIGKVKDIQSEEEGKPTSCEIAQEEGKWTQALERAIKESKDYGKVPAFAIDILDSRRKPKIDWEESLRRFCQESLDSSDYNWMNPNKKYDMYLPNLSIDRNVIPEMVFAIDTSRSMSINSLNQVVGELSSILEEYKVNINVLLTDTIVHKVLKLNQEDLPLKIEAVGRGGTDFIPSFEWVEKEEINPTCFLYYTDGDGQFPDKEPSYPVLWIGTQNFKPPFGEFIKC